MQPTVNEPEVIESYPNREELIGALIDAKGRRTEVQAYIRQVRRQDRELTVAEADLLWRHARMKEKQENAAQAREYRLRCRLRRERKFDHYCRRGP
jgi:hypothetical protein